MKDVIIGCSIFLLLLFALGIRPVPQATKNNCKKFTGKVAQVYESGVKDVVIRFHNEAPKFYINRGLEQGLDLGELQEKLTGEEVHITYPSYWTVFDPQNKIKHLAKLEIDGEVIYSEMRQ